MNALDSPLEALALNYLSFGFLTAMNSVWTWVAVITTAAFSVWKIRASSPLGKCIDESSQLTWRLSSPSPVVEPAPTSAEVAERSSTSTPSVLLLDRNGRTSGKFTVYYQKDDDHNDDGIGGYDVSVDGIGDDECDGVDGDVRKEVVCDSWELTMRMGMKDMGWYRYQDLTVLDGSVVRLWDDCRLRNAAPSITCGGVMTW